MNRLLIFAILGLCVAAIHKLPFTSEVFEDNILLLTDENFDDEI